MEVRSYLKDHILLFDGAMGTYYAHQYPDDAIKCEWANLWRPERVSAIHQAYLKSGARAIKTNTFGANSQLLECTNEKVESVIRAGWMLANESAAPFDAAVFADIGPLPEGEAEYDTILNCFLELGACNFLFETFASDAPVHDLAARIKARCPEAFVMVSFAVAPSYLVCAQTATLMQQALTACQDLTICWSWRARKLRSFRVSKLYFP